MIAIIILSNLLILAVIGLSLRYIFNNCNNTYVQFIEHPTDTISSLELPFLFQCLPDKNDIKLEEVSEEN